MEENEEINKRQVEQKKKEKKIGNIIIGFLLIVLLAAAIFTFTTFVKSNEEKIAIAFDEGMQQGYQNALNQFGVLALDCQQIPLTLGDQTMTLIPLECLNVED